jgi:hypothetical protein
VQKQPRSIVGSEASEVENPLESLNWSIVFEPNPRGKVVKLWGVWFRGQRLLNHTFCLGCFAVRKKGFAECGTCLPLDRARRVESTEFENGFLSSAQLDE